MSSRLVVSFHGIGEPHAWVGPDERPYWCDEDKFLSILDDIPQVSRERQIPIEITFDDGNVSDFEIAAAALQERGLTAAFFVCAGRIGEPGYLDATQMRELLGAGMTIGSHGWDHVDWRRLPDGDALDREVTRARDVISDTLEQAVESVAIPFGSYDHRVWRAVEKAFSIVCTSDGGLAPLSGSVVPREAYTTGWGPDAVRSLSAPPSLRRRVRQSLARAYKRHRGPLRAYFPTLAG